MKEIWLTNSILDRPRLIRPSTTKVIEDQTKKGGSQTKSGPNRSRVEGHQQNKHIKQYKDNWRDKPNLLKRKREKI